MLPTTMTPHRTGVPTNPDAPPPRLRPGLYLFWKRGCFMAAVMLQVLNVNESMLKWPEILNEASLIVSTHPTSSSKVRLWHREGCWCRRGRMCSLPEGPWHSEPGHGSTNVPQPFCQTHMFVLVCYEQQATLHIRSQPNIISDSKKQTI